MYEEGGGQCQDRLHITKSLYEQAPQPAKTSSHKRLVKQTLPLSNLNLSHQLHGSETALSCSEGKRPVSLELF